MAAGNSPTRARSGGFGRVAALILSTMRTTTHSICRDSEQRTTNNKQQTANSKQRMTETGRGRRRWRLGDGRVWSGGRGSDHVTGRGGRKSVSAGSAHADLPRVVQSPDDCTRISSACSHERCVDAS
ncbi:unnamed protein product [Protopolystoma xenopodis]|uniref:Uncharacterized protein n=1 Tax=Protopolystoma xenopodis TaxID=117903 RepID=A0A448WRF7_9PLAT|nr:unnamed protein product [Protopolystoma xenopodis]